MQIRFKVKICGGCTELTRNSVEDYGLYWVNSDSHG